MELYRAVPREKFTSGPQETPSGRRLPGNVPYFVDNLWELFRPKAKPSRRHSVYASLTPELALANATDGHLERGDYIVCRVVCSAKPKILQLDVADARVHADIGRLKVLLHQTLSGPWSTAPLAKKSALAALFLPAILPAELRQAASGSAELGSLIRDAKPLVKIWDTPSQPTGAPGELFFELPPGEHYILEPYGR